MPLSEHDFQRLAEGYIYLRDYSCLAGCAAAGDGWPYDQDRPVTVAERQVLAEACQIINFGGCHTILPEAEETLPEKQDAAIRETAEPDVTKMSAEDAAAYVLKQVPKTKVY